MKEIYQENKRKSVSLQLLLVATTALFLSGCLQQTVVSPLPPPTEYGRLPEIEKQEPAAPVIEKNDIVQEGPGAPLYKKAQKHLKQGDYQQAELVVERALRIEPKNGYYWYTLAQAKFGQQQLGKTVQLCLKSKSLAGGDQKLIRLNEMLMERAQ